MGVTLDNSVTAQTFLNEMNKSTRQLGKALKKLADGEKVDSASDDAAAYSISEKMRGRLLALTQANQNVQNGSTLLNVAEDSIQSQIDMLKQIKEYVINAANDTNTDVDRVTLQKQVNQLYRQIDDTAYDAKYNGISLLTGDRVFKTITSWKVHEDPVLVEGSEMDIIADTYENLSGIEGPFDTFNNTSTAGSGLYAVNSVTLDADFGVASLQNKSSVQFSGGSNEGTAAVKEIDFSALDIDTLKNQNTVFQVTGYNAGGNSSVKRFVLTTDTSLNFSTYGGSDWSTYNNPNTYNTPAKIDISGCSSIDDVVSAIKSKIDSDFGSTYFSNVTANGTKLTLTSANKTATSNYMAVNSLAGTPTMYGKKIDANTGGGSKTGGSYDVYTPSTDESGNTTYTLTTSGTVMSPWTATVDTSSFPSGIYISDRYTYTNSDDHNQHSDNLPSDHYFVITDSNTTYTTPNGQSDIRTLKMGTEQTITNNPNISIVWDGNGNITFTPKTAARHEISVTGYDLVYQNTDAYDKVYSALTSIGADKISTTTVTEGEDGTRAYVDLDFSNYSDVEDLISDFVGKAIQYYPGNSTTYMNSYRAYEFYDSTSETLDGVKKMDNASHRNNYTSYLDLNLVRQDVAGGKTIAEAFATRLKNLLNDSYYRTGSSRLGSISTYLDGTGKESGSANASTTGLRIKSLSSGTSGNNCRLNFFEARLNSYNVNFNTWFNSNSDELPAALDGKGFRFYCGTDSNEWFNIIFRADTDEEEDPTRPESGNDENSITSIEVDVTDVKNASDLVDAIYKQVIEDKNENMVNEDGSPRHFYMLAKNDSSGVLTVYDTRTFDISTLDSYNKPNEYSDDTKSYGAKIADGVMDTVEKIKRDLYIKDFVIHNGPDANQRVNISLPQMTVDHIFYNVPMGMNIEDYSLAIKDSRDKLLGTYYTDAETGKLMKDESKPSLLDDALEYLTDAITYIGAQQARFEFNLATLQTQYENDVNAESTIRDADMAKELAEYVHQNILRQASQSVLALTNQNASQVISLLQ